VCVANPGNPPSSIKLRDETGQIVRVTGQDRYSAIDPVAADAAFTELGSDIGLFAQMTVAARFNSAVFLAAAGTNAGVTGEFSDKIYNAYKKAIDQATAQLVKDGFLPAGAQSPLTTVPVGNVKPDFHTRRWAAFPSVEAQRAISAVCKNTVVLVSSAS
jgi:hypothetical protein